ncbi:MAG: CaiB/BaiF CoA transferase family protein [Janthinobacterium lividum]
MQISEHPTGAADGAARTADNTPGGPLRGFKVVDFTHFVAGPYATMLLADLGAEVFKVENPKRGDEFRHYPPYSDKLAGEGSPFLWVNRNKKSVAVDMKTTHGLRIVQELIRRADIVVENFTGGVMERFGIDYETVSKENPALIYCSISAYGRDGDMGERLGFDPIAQAESGFMSLNGYQDREGVRAGSSVIDLSSAMMASNAILAAVVERQRSGRGQRVSTSLYETAMNMVGYSTMQTLTDPDWVATRHGNSSPDTAPTGVYYASNGPMYIACTGTEIFRRLFTLIGREDLATNEELLVKANRLGARDLLNDALNAALATDTRENWLPKLRAARVPAGALRTIAESIAAPETVALKMITEIPHPTAGTIPNVRLPFTLEKSPIAPPVAAPALGQHTRHVLRHTLGYNDDQIDLLERSGAFGDKPLPAEDASAAARCPYLNPALQQE